MHSHLRILILPVIALALCAQPARAGVHLLDARADTWFEEQNPIAQHGSEMTLQVQAQAGDSMRAAVWFDLTSLPPGSSILKATLTFTVLTPDTSGAPVGVHRLTDTWDENSTWSDTGADWAPGAVAWLPPMTIGPVEVDITQLVREWADGTYPNHGVMLLASAAGSLTTVASREMAATRQSPTLLVQTADPPTGMRVATGSYDGNDNSNRAITGLGFAPDVVIVKGTNALAAVIKTNTMPGNNSKALGEPAAMSSGRIESLDADGFTVSNAAEVNALTERYDWVAFREAAGEMMTGTYDGNGQDAFPILGLGFEPGYVVVFNEGNFQAAQRFADQGFDESYEFDYSNPTANWIESFLPDGFTVGNDDETNGSNSNTYHFVAWNAKTATSTVASRLGTGSSPTDVTGLGFQPDVVFMKHQWNFQPGVFRLSSWSNDVTGIFPAWDYFTNGITSMLGDGYRLGSHPAVNGAGTNYYWTAFADAGPAGPTVDIAVGLSTDNATPWPGDTVSIVMTATNNGPDTASGLQLANLLPQGITYVTHLTTGGPYDPATGMWDVGGLASGDAAGLNISATIDPGTYGWTITDNAKITALSEMDTVVANNSATITFDVQNKQYHMTSGRYTGDGAIGHTVTGLGFTPDFVLVRSDAGNGSFVRTVTMPPGTSRELGSGDLIANAVISLDNDGFTLGSSTEVNDSGTRYYWAAFSAGPGVLAVNSYTGDGLDDRSVGGVGFQPDYVMIFPEINRQTVQRFPGQSGDATQPMTPGTALQDRIQVFTADGFQVGRNAQVNSDGDVFHYVAFNTGSARVAGGFYVGDGSPGALVGGSGFRPEYALVCADAALDATVQRFAHQAPDSSLLVPVGAPITNAIQSFTANGFQLGNHASVNSGGALYHWVAFDADTGVVPVDADLGVTVAFDRPVASEGDTISVSVRVANVGTAPAIGVAVTDSLSSGLQLVSATPGAGSYDIPSGVWSVGGLNSGASEVLQLVAVVEPATGGQQLVSRAWISAGNGGDLDPSNDTDADTLLVAPAVSLVDVPGSLYPPSAFPGDPSLGLRIDVDNPGDVGAILDTTSTITFSDGVSVYVARLGNPTFVPAFATNFTLAFRSAVVPAAFAPGTAYDLTLALRGITDQSVPYGQDLSTAGRNAIWIDQRMVRLEPSILGDDIVLPGARNVELLALSVQNGHAGVRTLDSLFVTNVTLGPGVTSQLDAAFERLLLYADVDNSATVSPPDTLLDATRFDAGRAGFAGRGWQVGGNAGGGLLVAVDVDSLVVRDGDLLDAAISWAADVRFLEPTTVDPSLTPLNPANSYGTARIDGMAAHQVGFLVTLDTLFSGTTDQVVGRLRVPPNGYTSDVFEGFEMMDISGGFTPSDFTAVKLYRDTGDAAFDPMADILIGTMAYTGDRYVISGFSQPVGTLGQIFWVTVDVALTPGNGDTFQPSIPMDGIRTQSGNDGPVNNAVIRNNFYTIVALEKIDISAQPVPGRVARPGDANVALLSFVVQNNTLSPVTLDSVTVTNVTAGPGTQAELDASMSALHIYRDSGDGAIDFRDALIGGGAFAGGRMTLPTALTLVPGEAANLLVACDVDSLCAADGDTLSAAIASSADLHFGAPKQLVGSFPLFSGGGALVNGLMSFQLTVFPSADSLIITTPNDNLVFDFGVPGNGYRADALDDLRLQNLGTATDEHIKRLALYGDGGDGVFDAGAGDDTWLGDMAEVLPPVPGFYRHTFPPLALPAGCGNFQRMFLAADLDLAATSGATIQFAVPPLGVQVASTNDGPIDTPVMDPSIKFIPKPDELTVFPYSVGDKSVHPGSKNTFNFGAGFYNGFDSPVTLTSMQLVQLGQVISSELDRVRAFADTDSNGLFSPLKDALIAEMTPGDNFYLLEDLDLELAEKRITYLFITYDLPLVVRDSVDVDMQLNSGNDLTFKTQAVTVRGQFPVNSPGVDFVDGMTAAQIALHTAPDKRVPPGDLNVLGLGFTVPRNGYLGEQLAFVSIDNEGTAQPGQDITLLSLWVDDDGDRSFNPASDRLLSTLNWIGSAWRNPVALAEAIGAEGLRCFVTANIAPTANDDRTMKLFVPVDGVEVALSANDGPIDRELRNPGTQTISTDPLLTSLALDRSSYSAGQTLVVTMTARNVGPDTLLAVHPGMPSAAGTGGVAPTSGPAPATSDIAPGGEVSFVWTFTATSAGDVTFCGQAFDADSSEVSVQTCTEPATLQNLPLGITLSLADIAPPGANRGQQDVQAIRIGLGYPGVDTLAASTRVTGIHLDIANGGGAAAAPNAYLENVTVVSSTGSNYPFAVSDSSASPLRLSFSVPIDLAPGDSIEMDVELDVAGDAVLAPMRMGLSNAGALRVVDANSDAAVTLATGTTFPWLTGAVNITSPAESLLVATLDTVTVPVNVAQGDVVLFSGSLTHPGPASAAAEILTRISLAFFDENGVSAAPGDAIRRLSIHSGSTTLYFTEAIPLVGDRMDCVLTTALLLPAQSTLPLEVRVDARSFPATGGLQAAVETPSDIEARDNHSDATIAVAAQPGSFPLLSRRLLFQQPATGLNVTRVSLAPETILPGQTNVPLLQLGFEHPDTAGSSVSLDSLVLEFSAPGGGAVPPGNYFNQLCIVNGTDTLAQVSSLSSLIPFAECRISPSVILDPGELASLTVLVDAKNLFSPTEFLLRVEKDYVYAIDENDGSRILGIGGIFPLASDPAWLRLLGDNASVAMVSRLPGNVAGTETDLAAFDLIVGNTSTPGHTAAELRRLDVSAETWEGDLIAPASVAGGARLMRLDNLIATGAVGPSGIEFTMSPGAVSIPAAQFDTLTVLLDLVASSDGSTFRLVIRDTTDIDIVDADTQASSDIAGTFPLRTGATHVLTADLAASFTNYPNPFPAGRGTTRITFFLEEPSAVSLELYTLWGAKVKTLIDNAQLSPGLHQDRVWDGLNGSGDVVANGVYYLVLEVSPSGGGEHKIKRKVGVVR